MSFNEKFNIRKEKVLTIKFLSNLTGIKESLMYKWSNNSANLSPEKLECINLVIEQLYDLYITTKKAPASIHYDDITGKKFNHLTALYPVGANEAGAMRWACQCDCGNPILRITTASSLKGNETVSCGCQRIYNGGKNFVDLSGKRFGKLTVIKRAENSQDDRVQWMCKCDCGKEVIIRSSSLISNKTRSCGCLSGSIGEFNIEVLLQKYKIPYKKEYTFSDLISPKGKLLRFDFAILNEDGGIKYLIEFDGKQHFDINCFNVSAEDFKYRQMCDNLKNKYCEKNGLTLIRIPYQKRDNITLEDLGIIC